MFKFLTKIWGRGMDTYAEEGYDAYNEGYGEMDNPYPDGSYAGSEWFRGWVMAEQGQDFKGPKDV